MRVPMNGNISGKLFLLNLFFRSLMANVKEFHGGVSTETPAITKRPEMDKFLCDKCASEGSKSLINTTFTSYEREGEILAQDAKLVEDVSGKVSSQENSVPPIESRDAEETYEDYIESPESLIDLVRESSGSVTTSSSDQNEYLLEDINDMRLVLVKDTHRGKNIILEAAVGWGYDYLHSNDENRSKVERFLVNRFSLFGASENLGHFSKLRVQTEPLCTLVQLLTYDKCAEMDLSLFFMYFENRKCLLKNISADAVLAEIEKGNTSVSMLETFFLKVFLGAEKITFILHGDPSDEQIEEVRRGIAGISRTKRVISDEEVETMRELFAVNFEDLDAKSPDGCYMVKLLPSNKSFSKGDVLQAAVRILTKKTKEDGVIADMLKKHGATGDIEFRAVSTHLRKGDPNLLKLAIVVPSHGVICNHERMLKRLFSRLQKIELSADEYQKFVAAMEKQFWEDIPELSPLNLVRLLSEGSLCWDEKDYLGHSYLFKDVTFHEVFDLIRTLFEDIEGWSITVVPTTGMSRLSKQDMRKIVMASEDSSCAEKSEEEEPRPRWY